MGLIAENYTDGYKDGVKEFIAWAYVNGIDFSFMAKAGKDGLYDTPQRLENIEKRFYEFKNCD